MSRLRRLCFDVVNSLIPFCVDTVSLIDDYQALPCPPTPSYSPAIVPDKCLQRGELPYRRCNVLSVDFCELLVPTVH